MIKQPENSNLCGQCCLATILHISLEEAINLIGHQHRTRTKELISHFKTNTNRLKKEPPSGFSLCRVHFGKEKITHWILYKYGLIYDPVIGTWINEEYWKRQTDYVKARITSSININLAQSHLQSS